MIHVQINKGPLAPHLSALLEQAAEKALQHQGANPESDLSLVLSDDLELRALNRRHLERDLPTDVLSFPSASIDPETGTPYLGDVIISVERAEEQAKKAGHSLEAELQLLVVHGVLHLLGHDHAGDQEKAEMWGAQARILEDLGAEIDLAALDQLKPHH